MPCITLAAAALAQTVPPPSASKTMGFTASDELNKNLPKWMRFSGLYGGRLEGFTHGGFRERNDDLYFLNRFRLNLLVLPTPWLKFSFQAQDARVFGKNQKPPAPPYQDAMDLRMAFVEVGDAEKGSFGLRAGRQELVFGEQRLVGHVSWLNTARSFDAVRATFRQPGFKLDAFASSVVPVRDGVFNHPRTGNNFHGLYGTLDRAVPRGQIEPYVFWRVAPGGLDFKTIGFRWAGKLPLNFDYGAEIAAQTGSFGLDSIGAWAGHWLAGYTVPKVKYTPRLIAEWNYASGDENPNDRKRGTFDQLYPTAHDLYGLADQVGWRNLEHFRSGVELKATPKLALFGNYHSYWLASARDGIYGAGGAMLARAADGSAGRRAGWELDFQAKYACNKQINLWGGYAHLFPGEFLKKTTPGRAYRFPYLMVTYAF
ncbi:MAG: alginate export family protein [Acidobacteria bacterium]|nr:alginate export family protein [Acidobacteriota bacterium]